MFSCKTKIQINIILLDVQTNKGTIIEKRLVRLGKQEHNTYKKAGVNGAPYCPGDWKTVYFLYAPVCETTGTDIYGITRKMITSFKT